MTVHSIVDRNEKATLSSLRHTNEAVLDLVKPLFTVLQPYLRMTMELPGFDRLPTPKETVALWFEFGEGVLKEQKEFLTRLVALLPEPRVETPVTKPSTKAA